MYSGGASERRLGELARDAPAVLATKFPSGFLARADRLPRDLDASLARLGRVDLYQHHFPVALGVDPAGDGADGRRRRGGPDQGRRREQLLGRAAAPRARGPGPAGGPLASNQVEYSLLHRQPEVDGVLDACRELGVTLIAYQPLASGALTGRYAGGPTGRRGLRRFGNRSVAGI